ncbi:MAG: extracellular solute-binding protein [Eubacteriales bacterium]|jgi:ABC-type glycerol-3-phosphate transport system substrate-binding protein
MKKSIRFIAFLLLLLICASAVSCTKPAEDDAGTTTAGSDNTTEDPGEETYEKDNLPEGLNYNSDVRILHWTESKRVEFFTEKETGDVANDAVFARNRNIEERLGVKLVWHGEPGNVSNTSHFVSVVQKSIASGDRAYDITATYSRTAGLLAVDGYLADINKIEDSYLDFTKPWWPDNMLETVTIGNSVYFITGDAATSVLHYMTAIFYNKNLLDAQGIQYPSTDVRNNTWTLDRLIEITSNQYQDLDSNGKQSDGDFYGFTTIYYNADAFYTGAGMWLVEHDADGMLKISDDFVSERAINLVDKLGKWLTTDTCYVSRSGAAVDYYVPFANGTALACQLRAFMIDPAGPCSLTNVDWEFGIVPNPKYDQNQENYATIIGNPFTIFGIIKDADDDTQSMCSAVLECWGSEAYRLTTPAVFENCMKLRYSATETESEMFDVVRGSVIFDLGRIFSEDLNRMSELPSKAMTTGVSWASAGKTHKKALDTKIKGINEDLSNLSKQN